MAFSSLGFIFHFLPIFLITYFAVKPKFRNIVLLVGSLVFYSFGKPWQLLLLLISTIVNYLLVGPIYDLNIRERKSNISTQSARARWLALAIIYDIGLLVYFKVNMPNELPVGISFYTFQMVSFAVDVYRGEYRGHFRLFNYVCYATCFPQITSGPITRYADVYEQLENNRVVLARLERGAAYFAFGLGTKVLLADKIAALWSDICRVGPYGIDSLAAWLGAWGYSFQIYFDFWGYSLMAMGVGSILGFTLPVNFNNPYCAKTMTDFWRRWHITLGKWFRDYLYIPMGGNRVSKVRNIVNIFVVWMLTALWHGGGINFIIWGLFLFYIIMLEKLFFGEDLQRSKIGGHIYMFIIIPVSWMIFTITDLNQLREYFIRLLFLPLPGMVVNGYSKFTELLDTYWWLLLLCILFSTPLPGKLFEKHYKAFPVKIILLVIFWLSIYQLVMTGSNPFVYFKF